MTPVAIPAFRSHGGELPAPAASPLDRSPEGMQRLRSPFEATAASGVAADPEKTA